MYSLLAPADHYTNTDNNPEQQVELHVYKY